MNRSKLSPLDPCRDNIMEVNPTCTVWLVGPHLFLLWKLPSRDCSGLMPPLSYSSSTHGVESSPKLWWDGEGEDSKGSLGTLPRGPTIPSPLLSSLILINLHNHLHRLNTCDTGLMFAFKWEPVFVLLNVIFSPYFPPTLLSFFSFSLPSPLLLFLFPPTLPHVVSDTVTVTSLHQIATLFPNHINSIEQVDSAAERKETKIHWAPPRRQA